MKRSTILEAFRKDDLAKYKAILQNSPGTGLNKDIHKSRLENKQLILPNRFNNDSICYQRTSLFTPKITSSAINENRLDRQPKYRIDCRTPNAIQGKIFSKLYQHLMIVIFVPIQDILSYSYDIIFQL